VDVLEDEVKTLTWKSPRMATTSSAPSMQPTDGLVRRRRCGHGRSISVPVGDVTKGHVFNVLGETRHCPPLR
jgi:F-type H+-transporting ATPase subunit beta